MSSSTETLTIGTQVYTLFKGINLKLLAYVLIAIIVEVIAIIYGVRSQPPMFLMIAIFVPLSIYIFIIYGIQWFGDKGPFNNATVPWPPAINSCPDFLTAYNIPATSTRAAITGCVDTIGVAKGGNLKYRPTGQPDWNPAPTAPISASKTDANGATMLLSTGFFATKVAGESVAQVCERCQKAGVTWEGVWDGQSCFSNGSNIPTDAGGSSCPT
jgi:hypothetical protein